MLDINQELNTAISGVNSIQFNALQNLFDKTLEQTGQVNTKIDDLSLQDTRFDSRRREIGEQNHAAKQYMANSFEELRKRID